MLHIPSNDAIASQDAAPIGPSIVQVVRDPGSSRGSERLWVVHRRSGKANGQQSERSHRAARERLP